MEQNGQANNPTNEKQQEANLSQHTHVEEPAQAVKDEASSSGQANLRHDWTLDEIIKLLETPLMDLVYQAQSIHRIHHPGGNVQLASLLSIKTGACPEDCKYCPQSAHYAKKTGLAKEPLMDVDDVLSKAEKAKDAGASRFCMGAAWREVRDDENFENVITMVKGVKDLGLEACVTLGMLSEGQAERLADAGLTSYNHNIDTSEDFYSKIITTRTYEDRINTISNVQKAGISLCSGGIIGLGESLKDRASMLQVLANLPQHPGSVPINTLVAVPGTPLEDQKQVDSIELVRMVATARIMMPKARVRLSAGRESLNDEAQILCFMAGANSVFYGEKLLTTGNNDALADQTLIQKAGLGTD